MTRGYGFNRNSLAVIYDEGFSIADTDRSARALGTLDAPGFDRVLYRTAESRPGSRWPSRSPEHRSLYRDFPGVTGHPFSW